MSAFDRVMARIRVVSTGCWEFTGARNSAGYGIVGLGGREKPNDRAHRVVFRHFKGEIPKGFYVCHSCDNPPCCNPEHLFAGSPKDNRLDCKRKGRDQAPPVNHHLRGERHYAARFTADQVEQIRRELEEGGVANQIAKRFGVSRDAIGKIKRGERWKS